MQQPALGAMKNQKITSDAERALRNARRKVARRV
jgi:hypothetical protein